MLGEIEEYFIEQLTPGDTFLFAGEVLRFEGIRENEALCQPRRRRHDPKIPSYVGGKFPLSTYLAARVRGMLADPDELGPPAASRSRDWLRCCSTSARCCPGSDELLVETFPRGSRYYLVAYPFEGRLAHQTLGMLLTRRLERARAQPLGFVATDYALAIWGLRDLAR